MSTLTVDTSDTAASRALLAGVRDQRAIRDAAEIELFAAAVAWAALHPVDEDHWSAEFSAVGLMRAMPLAGPGAPEVAEESIAEFALALGMSTESGQSFLGDALEVHHRLPALAARVYAGDLAVWRARRVAERTRLLSPEAAAHVDRLVAPVAHKSGPIVTDRLVEEAIARYMPALAAERAERSAEGRHFVIEHDQVSLTGTSRVHGELDLADALDLEAAVSQGASMLAAWGCEASLDVRRAKAVGEFARRQLALGFEAEAEDAAKAGRGARAGRQVVLYVHLTDRALSSPECADLASIESGSRLITAEQVREWCAGPNAKVAVKPVIDLNDCVATSAYHVPDRIAERVALRDGTVSSPGVRVRRGGAIPARVPTPTATMCWPTQPAVPPAPAISRRSADDTIASRPTPPGHIKCWHRAAICGPAHSGSNGAVTTPALPNWIPFGAWSARRADKPADFYPAPLWSGDIGLRFDVSQAT